MKYTCQHCGRKLKEKTAHTCNGNFRKRKLKFKETKGASK
jgi:hypothetical protein